jgi:ADP-ribose pyrophosphatase YjhB (NUDIX family)
MKYRVSAKGLLQKDNKVLFIKYGELGQPYYALPGGGQDIGESLQETIVREMKEETGLDVIAGELILESSDVPGWEQGMHSVEVIFKCTLRNESQEAVVGEMADTGTLGVEWLAITDFHNHLIYPTASLKEIIETDRPIYLFS